MLVLVNRHKVTASPAAMRAVCVRLLPALFIVTVWQLYNLLPSEIGTLMKNNSEELLRVARIEVLKPYASFEMRNLTFCLAFHH